MREVLIIANPIAGGGRASKGAPELRDALAARGLRADLRFTADAGDVVRFAHDADPRRFAAVVSVGGDGTLNTVLDNLPDPTVPLAMMPYGTANVLAHELRLPRAPADLALAIDAGRTIGAAIGLAQPLRPEGARPRRFLLFAGAGLDGAMVEELERVRRGTLGKLRWVKPVLTIVRHLPRHRLRIETDTGEVRDDLSEALVTRVRSYGGVFAMPGPIDIEDRVFHVLCFRQRTRWQWLRAAFRAWLGRLRLGTDVEHLTARTVRIDAAASTPYHLDGDFGGRTPLRLELDPRQARLVVSPRLPSDGQ